MLGLISSMPFAIMSIFIGGFSFGIASPAFATIAQKSIDRGKYGRYKGASYTLAAVIDPCGKMVMGIIIGFFGVRYVFALMIFLYLLTSFLALGICINKKSTRPLCDPHL